MERSAPLEHAGVNFPPPFIYVAGIAAGWLLQRLWPWSLPWSATTRTLVAAVGIALWLALFLSALVTFRRARTTLIPNQPATAVVTAGPYRLTRNPMYVSLVALYLGVAAFIGSWWPFVLLPLVIVAVDRGVIAREERYLASAFPAEYSAYRMRVRRWV